MDKKCVVVGGGAVAARKAGTLLDAGAKVSVIAPELSAEMKKLLAHGSVPGQKPEKHASSPAKRITHVARRYRKGDLRGAFITIAATDDADVNLKVCRDAEDLGILVNCATPAEAGRPAGNFIVPSASERSNLTIAVSTGGKCPALAKRLRRELDEYTAGYAALLEFLEEARAKLPEVMPHERDRAAALDKLALRLMETFRTLPRAKALKLAAGELRKLIK